MLELGHPSIMRWKRTLRHRGEPVVSAGRMAAMRANPGLALITILALAACETPPRPEATQSQAAEERTKEPESHATPTDTQRFDPKADPKSDSAVVEQRLAWARQQRLDTLPIGEIVARMGRTFVGYPYIPGTLEADGPEHLVINLHTFDCVTFVENMLALARVVRAGGHFPEFKRELTKIRYRNGELNGYPSRLHYFSDWIANNSAKGIVKNITRELGGVLDTEPINFMSAHVESYRQLADTAALHEIKATEKRLNTEQRYVIPKAKIAGIADQIHDGDIIAAASSLPGLDIAHTGIALWVDGKLHLMHAPLVGSVVEISKEPLADRIMKISKQDGIMVARPL
jgi:hypothetical protein